MRIYTRIYNIVFLFLILGAPLSKYPSIALPAYDFSSFRLGLYQLTLAVFVVMSLPIIARRLRRGALDRMDRLVYGSVALLSVSALVRLFSAENMPRSALMTASLALLLVAMAGAYTFVKSRKIDYEKVGHYMLYIGIVGACISVVQLVVATFASKETALLCSGCASDVFGFPRVSGLGAEPLFWANSLLPYLAVAYVMTIHTKTHLAKVVLVTTSMAITLTFARGAYIAVGVMIICAVAYGVYKKQKLNLTSLGLITAGFIAGSSLLIGSAVVRYNDAPYIAYNTFRGMLEHVSLGIIDLEEKVVVSTQPSIAPVQTSDDEFVSQGLVEASSDDRLSSAELAIEAWSRPINTVFGVGMGNLGPYVVRNVDPSAPKDLTVYIFYVLFLVEMGIFGLGLLLILYGVAVARLLRMDNVVGLCVGMVIIGFAVQYMFFGSYINVGYIWVCLGIALGIKSTVSTHDKKKSI